MECFLQHAELAGFRQRLNRFDGRALRFGHWQEAGFHQDAVDKYRTCPAFARAAALFVARQVEVIADEIEQALMRSGTTGNLPSVDHGRELKVRHRSPPIQVRASSD